MKECPGGIRDHVRCIDCICNLCENDCLVCDKKDCEPQIINTK